MPRIHFYEAIERDNDYQKEYIKLEEMCERICGLDVKGMPVSINSWISEQFLKWKKRSNYTSFSELRDHLGFSLEGYERRPIDEDLSKISKCLDDVKIFYRDKALIRYR